MEKSDRSQATKLLVAVLSRPFSRRVEEEVAAVEVAMAVQPRPTGVTTSMRRSVGSMVSEFLKPTLSTTSKRNTWGSEFQRRGLRACKKR